MFSSFPQAGAAAGSQVRFEDGTWAGYGLVLCAPPPIGDGKGPERGGTFSSFRELYPKKGLEIFRKGQGPSVCVWGWGDGYTDRTSVLFPGNLDGEWEGMQICRALCLGGGAGGRMWFAGRKWSLKMHTGACVSSPSAWRCEWGVHAEPLSGFGVTTGA